MQEIIKALESRLASKKEEYDKQSDYFRFTATKEHGTSNYERNAIGDLSSMLKLSSEIHELEFVISLIKACDGRS